MCSATKILHGAAVILHGMVSILSDVPDFLHVQHQFFEIFLIFQKCSKISLVGVR